MSIVIPFRITSDRIHDIELHKGTTLGEFKSILANAGYDVRDAYVVIRRHKEKDALIGKTDSYKLHTLDAVEFNTEIVDMPVANGRRAERMAHEAARRCAQCRCAGQEQPGIYIRINGRVRRA